jgi:hypothetical protein
METMVRMNTTKNVRRKKSELLHLYTYNGYRGSFLGRRVKHSTHLAPRLKKEYSYTSTLSLGFHYMLQGEIYLKELVIAHEAKNFLIFEVL